MTEIITPLSVYTLFGYQPCLSPRTEYESSVANNLDMSAWLNKANSYYCPLGPEVGIVHVLMLKRDLDKLDLNQQYFLEFGLIDNNGAVFKQTIYGPFTIIKAFCTSPGFNNDPDSAYVVEAVDRRYLAKNIPINLQINIFAPDSLAVYPYANKVFPYYKNSLFSGAPYTWTQAIKTIWETNGKLGAFPGLPYVPPGFPENYQFIGVDSYDALNVLLAKIYCALRYDPINDEFSIVLIGSDIDNLATAEANNDKYVIHDKYPVQSVRGTIPEKIRVHFNKRHQYYGNEVTTVSNSGQWVTDSFVFKELPLNVPGFEADTTKIIWDDLAAIVDKNGVVLNDAELVTKTQSILTNFTTNITSDNVRLSRTYGTLVSDIIPGGKIKLVIWHHYGLEDNDGLQTTIVRTHGFFNTELLPTKPNDSILSTAENLKPPDFSRPTYPNYFPQIQIIEIVNGTPIDSLYDAKVISLNPETLLFDTYDVCWAFKNPNDGQILKQGDRWLGKISGTKDRKSPTGSTSRRQLYTILQNCCGIDSIITNFLTPVKVTSYVPLFTTTNFSLYPGVTLTYTTTGSEIVETATKDILVQLPKNKVPDLFYTYIGVLTLTYNGIPTFTVVPDQMRTIQLITGIPVTGFDNIFEGYSFLSNHDSNTSSVSQVAETCWIEFRGLTLLQDTTSQQALSTFKEYTGKFAGFTNINNLGLRPLYYITPDVLNIVGNTPPQNISDTNLLAFNSPDFIVQKTFEGQVKVFTNPLYISFIASNTCTAWYLCRVFLPTLTTSSTFLDLQQNYQRFVLTSTVFTTVNSMIPLLNAVNPLIGQRVVLEIDSTSQPIQFENAFIGPIAPGKGSKIYYPGTKKLTAFPGQTFEFQYIVETDTWELIDTEIPDLTVDAPLVLKQNNNATTYSEYLDNISILDASFTSRGTVSLVDQCLGAGRKVIPTQAGVGFTEPSFLDNWLDTNGLIVDQILAVVEDPAESFKANSITLNSTNADVTTPTFIFFHQYKADDDFVYVGMVNPDTRTGEFQWNCGVNTTYYSLVRNNVKFPGIDGTNALGDKCVGGLWTAIGNVGFTGIKTVVTDVQCINGNLVVTKENWVFDRGVFLGLEI